MSNDNVDYKGNIGLITKIIRKVFYSIFKFFYYIFHYIGRGFEMLADYAKGDYE